MLALSLLYGYPLAALLGIPAFLLFRRRNWLRFWQVCLAGVIIGSLVPLGLVVLVAIYMSGKVGLIGAMSVSLGEMGVLVPFGSAVGVLCAGVFWLLAYFPQAKGASEVKQGAA
jgi:hypothetical protein